jgi:hypothetical protein
MRKTLRTTLFVTLFSTLSSQLFSCGKNNGTPRPQSSGDDPSGNAQRPLEGANFQLADAKLWRAGLSWSKEPAYSDEAFLEMTGSIYFRLENGAVPQQIKDVKLTADMPEHGHGTGNILPVVMPIAGQQGDWYFENLYFTMPGLWRIRVTATVDGQTDVWTTQVQVKG